MQKLLNLLTLFTLILVQTTSAQTLDWTSVSKSALLKNLKVGSASKTQINIKWELEGDQSTIVGFVKRLGLSKPIF
jgi:hypothetical protein